MANNKESLITAWFNVFHVFMFDSVGLCLGLPERNTKVKQEKKLNENKIDMPN